MQINCEACRGTGLIDTGQACHRCGDRPSNRAQLCRNCEGWSEPGECSHCGGTGWVPPGQRALRAHAFDEQHNPELMVS